MRSFQPIESSSRCSSSSILEKIRADGSASRSSRCFGVREPSLSIVVHRLETRRLFCTALHCFVGCQRLRLQDVSAAGRLTDSSTHRTFHATTTTTTTAKPTTEMLQRKKGKLAKENLPPSFDLLPDLDPLLLQALKTKNLHKASLTEIQARTWELGLTGRDIVGRSRTGSGKV
jgi:hypothetical protein